MTMQATPSDAQIILQLYDLRREPELRKARAWWLAEFWPENFDAYMKVSSAMGTQPNAWLRQVLGYWEMAASLVNHGAVNADLFLEPAFCAEMFFLFAKLSPFLKDLREKVSPTFLHNVEKVVSSTEKSREYLKRMETNVANRRKANDLAAKPN